MVIGKLANVKEYYLPFCFLCKSMKLWVRPTITRLKSSATLGLAVLQPSYGAH